MTMTQILDGMIDEFAGTQCDELLGVAESSTRNAVFFAMMRSGGRWFRFTIDAGVLFLDPSGDPASSGDVGDEDEVLDLLPAGGPVEIESIQFHDGVLKIALVETGSIQFSEDVETSMMKISYSR